MNTPTDTNQKPKAPFALVIEFKAQCLFNGKHKRWCFRSDIGNVKNPNATQQLNYLLNLVKHEYKGMYLTASIFDNRHLHAIPYGQEKPNNLIFQAWCDQVVKDSTSELDLTYIIAPAHEYNFKIDFEEAAKRIFDQQNNEVMRATFQLSEALQMYKLTLKEI